MLFQNIVVKSVALELCRCGFQSSITCVLGDYDKLANFCKFLLPCEMNNNKATTVFMSLKKQGT